MVAARASSGAPLAWAQKDLEQRLFFRGGRHTSVNIALAALLGLILTILFYLALISPPLHGSGLQVMFTERGSIPYATTFFTCWSLAILFLKWRKLEFQRRALRYDVVPRDVDFVLSAANVDHVVDEIYSIADDPKHFVLYNRIVVALANLKNLGRVGDLDEILKSQAENDEAASDVSYGVLAGFIWAIPVLGFIGTVVGLSDAMGKFGTVLAGGADMEKIKESLMGVTVDLSVAFVTTLQALIAALIIQLLLTFLKKSEHEFLAECQRYCTSQIVNKLRIMPFERGVETSRVRAES